MTGLEFTKCKKEGEKCFTNEECMKNDVVPDDTMIYFAHISYIIINNICIQKIIIIFDI